MKNLLKITVILLLTFNFSLLTFGQTPNQFKYQAVLRDASGNILANQSVEVDISILQGSASGTSVFDETHNVTTTAQGLINLNIGSEGDLSTVDFSADIYFIEITVDGTLMGTSQLLAVPYALTAKNVENDQVEDDDADPENELQDLTLNGTTLEISNGTSADLSSLQDGTGTDDQNLTGATLTGTSLEITIEDGNSATVDLAGLQDGVGDGSETVINAGTNITITGTGTSGDPYEISASGGTATHYIGELFGGGIVFWVSPDGQHGLVMSIDDISSAVAWSNITGTAVGNAKDMYDGLANSNAIVAQTGHTTSAAQLCLDYSYGGFDDWYLPASWQISQIYHNAYTLNYVLANDGNAASVPLTTDQTWSTEPYPVYSSSTEYGGSYMWCMSFQYGYTDIFNKSGLYRVRAVRAF